jgi:hypothetical protein
MALNYLAALNAKPAAPSPLKFIINSINIINYMSIHHTNKV